MWRYDSHPPHLINVATLPSESQNTENVILQRDVTKENCIRCHSFIKVDQGHHALNLLIRGVIQQCVYETKIHNIDNLRKPLKQTWFDFAQNITDSAIDKRHDHLRSCVCVLLVVDTLNTFSFIWFTGMFYETGCHAVGKLMTIESRVLHAMH